MLDAKPYARVRSGNKRKVDSILLALLTRGNNKRTQIEFLAGLSSFKYYVKQSTKPRTKLGGVR